MHAYGALHLATAPEQITQGKMQFHCLRIYLDHFDERFYRFVRLFVEQKIQPFEIRYRQRARFQQQLLDIDARGNPAQAKKQRKCEQPPEFNFHLSTEYCGMRDPGISDQQN